MIHANDFVTVALFAQWVLASDRYEATSVVRCAERSAFRKFQLVMMRDDMQMPLAEFLTHLEDYAGLLPGVSINTRKSYVLTTRIAAGKFMRTHKNLIVRACVNGCLKQFEIPAYLQNELQEAIKKDAQPVRLFGAPDREHPDLPYGEFFNWEVPLNNSSPDFVVI